MMKCNALENVLRANGYVGMSQVTETLFEIDWYKLSSYVVIIRDWSVRLTLGLVLSGVQSNVYFTALLHCFYNCIQWASFLKR